MARGDSGRIVIDVDPELKRALYLALAISGSTLKDWFVKQATRHCAEVQQPSLFRDSEAAGLEGSDDAANQKAQDRHQ